MKQLITIILVAVFGVASIPMAGNSAQQRLALRVVASTQLGFTEDEDAITETSYAAAPPVPASGMRTDHFPSLRWNSFIAPGHASKITAGLAANHALGIIYTARLAEPNGSNGTSTGWRNLSPYAVDMLTGISNENCIGATISYESLPSEISSVLSSQTPTVIWTITDTW